MQRQGAEGELGLGWGTGAGTEVCTAGGEAELRVTLRWGR